MVYRSACTAVVALFLSSWHYHATAQSLSHMDPSTQRVTERVAVSLTAVEALDAMASGRMTSEQYVDILLGRIDNHPEINAFIHLDPEQVRAAARSADRERAAGRIAGPLHGLPIVVKDSINVAGIPTTAGTPALAGFRPENHATVVQALLDAGAIVLGKTNLHELSAGYTTDNAFTGATRNPYDLERIAGGSSGGNGAALAARFAPLAIGEDTAGSVRVPAALTGTMGFRPTTGRYSRQGVVPLAAALDTVGPMARSVPDLALADAVITGSPAGLEAVSLKRLRIGVPHAHFRELLDPAIEKHLEKLLKRLGKAGATLVYADIPEVGAQTQQAALALALFEVVRDLGDFLAAQGTGLPVSDVASSVASPDVSVLLSLALSGAVPEQDYLAVRDGLIPLQRQTFMAYLADNDLDVVLYPTTPLPATLLGQKAVVIDGVELTVFDAYLRLAHYTPVIGAPTLSLPLGQGARQIPVGGVDIAGAPGDDRRVLAIGEAVSGVMRPVRPPKAVRPRPARR